MALWSTSCLLLASLICGVSTLRRLLEEYHWRTIDYEFPSRSFQDSLLLTGKYIPGNAVPLDVDSTEDGRVWLAAPRLNPGVPATLGTLADVPGNRSPILRPYPSWGWHREGDCNGITSVFRVQVDRCNRLWVPDNGQVDILRNRSQICPPQLLVFNTVTDHLVARHRIPAHQLNPSSLIVTIAVDITAACRDTVAYIADVAGFSLIVYSLRTRQSWLIESNYFYPYPRWGHFRIAGTEFDLMDGVLGLALGPPYPHGDRILYWHSLASDSESWVPTSILREPAFFENGTNQQARAFRVFPGTRAGQSAAEVMDDNGILFFGQLPTNSLMCWNSRFPYNEANLVELDRDDEALQFASGVKVIQRRGSQELWVMTSRFQKAFTWTLDPTDINFRVLRAPIAQLVQGTPCEIYYSSASENSAAPRNVLGWGV